MYTMSRAVEIYREASAAIRTEKNVIDFDGGDENSLLHIEHLTVDVDTALESIQYQMIVNTTP